MPLRTLRLHFVMLVMCCICCFAIATEIRAEGDTTWSMNGPHIYIMPTGGVGIGTASPTNKLDVVGNLGVAGDIHFPERGFRIGGGGALEWTDRVRLGAGGDGPGLPPWQGKMRAQPGSNIEILPLKDYARAALDIYPTNGKKPEFDALAELTLHRFMPSNNGHEMLSISALASVQDKYGVIVEAHGTGRVKSLDFMVVQGGLLEGDNQRPFWAQVMRMKTDGTMQFGALRTGPRNVPVDIISIEQDDAPRNVSSNQEGDESNDWKSFDGPSDSHFVRYTAKQFQDGRTAHRADWRNNVQIDERGQSSFVIQNRQDEDAYEKKLVIHDNGNVELATAAAGLILTSPNGKKWRITVDDNGRLRTAEAE